MNPTNITYEAMINAYGISGQMSQVKQVFAQMKEARIALTQNQMISLLLRLVKHGQAGNQFENLNYVSMILFQYVGKVSYCVTSHHMCSSKVRCNILNLSQLLSWNVTYILEIPVLEFLVQVSLVN